MSAYSDLIKGTSGLLYYSRMGGTGGGLVDETGGGRSFNGSGGTLVYGRPGAISGDTDTAMHFDGAQMLAIDTAFGITTDYTMEAWVKMDSGETGGFIACLGSGSVALNVAADKTMTLFRSNQAALTASASGTATAAWCHFAVSCAGGTYTYYLNGVAKGSFGGGAMNETTAINHWVGCHMGNGGFSGTLDEVAWYNRGLTQSEVQQRVSLATTLPPRVVPTPTPNTFAYADAVRPFFALARTEVVAFVGIGNSNWRHGGNGWEYGFKQAANARYQVAGEFRTFNDGGGVAGPSAITVPTLDPGAGAVTSLATVYAPAGGSSGAFAGAYFLTANDGAATTLYDGRDGLRFVAHYGTFTTGAGQFTPVVGVSGSSGADAFNGSGGIYAAHGAAVQTNVGSYGLSTTTLTLNPDAARTNPTQYQFDLLSPNAPATGPYLFAYLSFDQPARTTGFYFSTLDARGGQPLRVLRYDVQQMADAALTYQLAAIRSRLGGRKAVCVAIQETQNSRNASTVNPPLQSAGDTPAQYAANVQATIDRVTAIYALNGWSTADLYFLLLADHAIADPDDAQDVAYRLQNSTVICPANPRTAAVDLSQMYRGSQLTALGYYAASDDPNHLNYSGAAYAQIATNIFDGLSPVSGPTYVSRIVTINVPTLVLSP